MSFLKAAWRKLILANYVIEPALLTEFVPFGTELDLWQGKCYVSLVGFKFVDTQVLGLKIPFHTHFEEVNLRFYVRRKEGQAWKRGVVFIKEIVPRSAISWVANTLYGENYEALPMKHVWSETETQLQVSYYWKKESAWQTLHVLANKKAKEIEAGSETEFITEHYWGYARINDQKTNEYQVTHPRWMTYEVLHHEIEVDFGVVYGQKFEFLNRQQAASVMLAEGSEIAVEPKRTIL
ncbi:MAG: DUF2071 domain-containing protein [Microscillaceae bacterium]|nr:DUF2071 domain-containing protein [Microscillaceae bacterium]